MIYKKNMTRPPERLAVIYQEEYEMRRKSDLGRLELIVGIALIALGLFTLFRPNKTITGAVVLYGIIAAVTGVSDIAFYIKMERRTGFGPAVSLVTGILQVIAGLLLVLHPGAGTTIIAIMFPLWFIAHCISKLSHLDVIRIRTGTANYYLTIVLNIIGLVLGFIMLFNPVLSVNTVGFVMAFYLVVLGIDSLTIAFSDI
ncbi:MAG: DUF308 domain-containing protein [Oscillospiraceae bacterium]|nr:DUF308 domain-containing protein [Oscillospiraceae bacterium]